MERFSDVSGVPVICVETGESAGTVESVICKERDRVLGFLINVGKIGNKYGFVLIEDVLDAGKNKITVYNRNSIVRKRGDVKQYRKNGNWSWLNKKVMSDEGKLLGIIKDGVFDVNSGKISEIELSLGILEDLRDGRRRFRLREDTEFGEEFIVLKDGGSYG